VRPGSPEETPAVAEMRRLARKRNVRGKSGDPARGSWRTRRELALAVGRFDLDPFSNPDSHILADRVCMLEDGGDGFGGGRPGPGAYKCGGRFPLFSHATEETRVWLQPDYSMTARAFDHYAHARFVALLKFDPRTDWFKRIFKASEAIRVLWNAEFEPPEGVTGGGQSWPHALYFKFAADVTDAVRALTFGWTKPRKD
jgi:hypothetical protein